jgi:hypothetical protein
MYKVNFKLSRIVNIREKDVIGVINMDIVNQIVEH